MKARMFILMLLCMVVGCMPFSYERVNSVPNYPEQKIWKSAQIGETVEKNTGETIFTAFDVLFYDGFIVTQNFQRKPEHMMIYRPLLTGDKLRIIGKTDSGYFVLDGSQHKSYGQEWYWNYLSTEDGNLCGSITVTYMVKMFDEGCFKMFNKQKVDVKGIHQQELLYNGKSGQTIKIAYREFVKDMARPSYFQDLTYDLSESKTISFKGIKLDVLSASNSSIKFKVLESNIAF